MNMNYLCSQYWPRSSLLKSFKDLCPTLYSKVVKNMQYILGTPAETTLGFLFESDSEECIAILYRIKTLLEFRSTLKHLVLEKVGQEPTR